MGRAWSGFVDRFVGLVTHVANHAAASGGRTIDAATRDDLVAEVFATLLADDRAVLRRFRGHCSLATYLTVVARRVIVRRLRSGDRVVASATAMTEPAAPDRDERDLINADEIDHLMGRLDEREAVAVRMFHLEGRDYGEIGQRIGVATNSVGPLLSRARAKMRA